MCARTSLQVATASPTIGMRHGGGRGGGGGRDEEGGGDDPSWNPSIIAKLLRQAMMRQKEPTVRFEIPADNDTIVSRILRGKRRRLPNRAPDEPQIVEVPDDEASTAAEDRCESEPPQPAEDPQPAEPENAGWQGTPFPTPPTEAPPAHLCDDDETNHRTGRFALYYKPKKVTVEQIVYRSGSVYIHI